MLNTLYKEYDELFSKMQKIKDLIVMYGGVVPDARAEHDDVDDGDVGDITNYPRDATLRDKVLYVVKYFNRPVTIADIYSMLLKLEPDLKRTSKNLRATIGQYCSTMKDKELSVDTSEFRHKYSLNEQ